MIKLFEEYESKNYGDLYKTIFARKEDVVDIAISVLKNGFKFFEDKTTTNGYWKGKFKFLKHPFDIDNTSNKSKIYKYSLCTSRSRKYLDRDFLLGSEIPRITFILDGKLISDKYKIEPFNFYRPNSIFSNKHWNEEKILSTKPEYLNIKYIKEVILDNRDSDIDSIIKKIISENIHNIKITILQ